MKIKSKDKITLLAIGDRQDYDSFMKLYKERRTVKECGWDFKKTTYDELLTDYIPKIRSEKVLVFLFFPFVYWNKNIEHKKYKGVYGNKTFYNKFNAFFENVEKALKRNLKGKNIHFVNSPFSCSRCRDKNFVSTTLKKTRIPIPKELETRNSEKIINKLKKGSNFFIKPQFGSMGKGITFLSNARWQTNFTYRSNKILSRKSDSGWKFKSIIGNKSFLKKLLKCDINIEEEIDPLLINNRKFDLRIYTFFGKAFYVYPRTNEADRVTTNISQGGKGHKQSFLKLLPERIVKLSIKRALDTTKVLGLNFSGVDIIIHKNLRDIYVLDVNAFPGFPKRKRFNLAKHLIKDLKRNFK